MMWNYRVVMLYTRQFSSGDMSSNSLISIHLTIIQTSWIINICAVIPPEIHLIISRLITCLHYRMNAHRQSTCPTIYKSLKTTKKKHVPWLLRPRERWHLYWIKSIINYNKRKSIQWLEGLREWRHGCRMEILEQSRSHIRRLRTDLNFT